MSVIVTDAGFAPEDFTGSFLSLDALTETPGSGLAVDVASDADVTVLTDRLNDLEMVRIDFPAFSDGRGFTLATLVKRMGFKGRLRAKGHVIADQYAMARRVGFDEVEISDDLAARQPAEQWAFRADWSEFNHQARMRG